MRLLLLSNSMRFGGSYLDYCADEIRAVLGASVRRVLFVPYALHDRRAYAARARARFEDLGFGLDSAHDAAGGPCAAVERAEAIFIGGGNTFRLVDALWREQLIDPIRDRVLAGMPYLGVSAGSNVACPTMRTTNDMPIIEPPTFETLDLVPFQINPHYLDPAPDSTHMGETREQRIREFHEENPTPVVGLREGAWLRIDDAAVRLGGLTGARLFRRNEPPEEFMPGARLDFLMERD
jgi:dipeptidase E